MRHPLHTSTLRKSSFFALCWAEQLVILRKLRLLGIVFFLKSHFLNARMGLQWNFANSHARFSPLLRYVHIKIIVSVTQDIPIAIIYNVFMVFCEAAACYHIVVCSFCCCLHHIKNMLQKKKEKRERNGSYKCPRGQTPFKLLKLCTGAIYIYIYTNTHVHLYVKQKNKEEISIFPLKTNVTAVSCVMTPPVSVLTGLHVFVLLLQKSNLHTEIRPLLLFCKVCSVFSPIKSLSESESHLIKRSKNRGHRMLYRRLIQLLFFF